MLRFSHDERLMGSARQREPISMDVSIFLWWFNFKCLQHQITQRAPVWLCTSAAQTGRVLACVCVCVSVCAVAVWWLCANAWQSRETERDPQTKTFHG